MCRDYFRAVSPEATCCCFLTMVSAQKITRIDRIDTSATASEQDGHESQERILRFGLTRIFPDLDVMDLPSPGCRVMVDATAEVHRSNAGDTDH